MLLLLLDALMWIDGPSKMGGKAGTKPAPSSSWIGDYAWHLVGGGLCLASLFVLLVVLLAVVAIVVKRRRARAGMQLISARIQPPTAASRPTAPVLVSAFDLAESKARDDARQARLKAERALEDAKLAAEAVALEGVVKGLAKPPATGGG